MAYKVEVHRGRKVSANYQSYDASISITAAIDVPAINPDAEGGCQTLAEQEAVIQQQIASLWRIAEAELDAKVAELEQQAGQHSQLPAAAPVPARQTPVQNGYAPGPHQAPPAGQPGRGGYPNQQQPAAAPPAYQRAGQAPQGQFGQLPRSGKHFFPWAKKQEEIYGPGLVAYINNWAKSNGFGTLMNQWDDSTTALAVAEAVRCLSSMQTA